MQLGITVFSCPEVKGSRRDFIDHGVCAAARGQVNGFDVRLAGVAALHANVGKLGRGIDRKPVVVFLCAVGTEDAAKLPFAKTERAQQRPERSVALLAQNSGDGPPPAKGTQPRARIVCRRGNPRADPFGARLQE